MQSKNFDLQLVSFLSHYEDRANTLPKFNHKLIAVAWAGVGGWGGRPDLIRRQISQTPTNGNLWLQRAVF